ncbi:hypothetical protein [Yoonia sp. 2307UL14-13]|uniref:hypothetical protein n=1 Tax=Yoonia sp. 2307UL14-13 TaxID=3126506 RepID=UPI0030A229B3
MRLHHLACLPAFALSATAAQAGCFNYEESPSTPAPLFEICYGDVCDVTPITYECANQYNVHIGFEIGWSKTCDVQARSCDIFWQGRPIDPEKVPNITCRPLDAEDFCDFP